MSAQHPGTASEVLKVFLKLGLTSFGGPIAHLGYFRAEFVERRQWLSDRRYSDLVALCQFLPGPASSQVGMALGLWRAGWLGALAAWAGFTLPSAIALVLFAMGAVDGQNWAQSGIVHGLKVMAVAVVAQAVWGMSRSLCPDRRRQGLAIGAAAIVLALPTASSQILVIVLGGLIGRWLLPAPDRPASEHDAPGVGRQTGSALLALFGLLLLTLPILATVADSPMLSRLSVFYQAGSLVFGGGHVVLPLLQTNIVPPGWLDNDLFLAGYAAAQAVPGPLFSFAAYLGAAMPAPLGGWSGGMLALASIFLPAFLLLAGALPYWEALRQRSNVQRAMSGINAAVVGILAAALYNPVWTSAIHRWPDLAMALAAFTLLISGRVSPVLVVALTAATGTLLASG
ncbi:MAG: chromate efflux transporter [Azonexaceae bacterium]|nr:chromate efflux transporter [Azonexaceae bacterium]